MQEQAELQDIKINSKIIDLKVLNNTFLCFKSSDNHECKSTTGFKLCKYYSYDKFCVSFMNKIITDKQIHNIFTNLITLQLQNKIDPIRLRKIELIKQFYILVDELYTSPKKKNQEVHYIVDKELHLLMRQIFINHEIVTNQYS
jgi:hypothetical protein